MSGGDTCEVWVFFFWLGGCRSVGGLGDGKVIR